MVLASGQLTTADWATVATAAFTAFAALAAWWAAELQRRQQRDQARPHLSISLAIDTSGAQAVHVVNSGPGLAIHPTFWLLLDEVAHIGSIGTPFLRPGADREIHKSGLPKVDISKPPRLWGSEYAAICWCMDSERKLRAFSATGKWLVARLEPTQLLIESFPRRRRIARSVGALITALCPDVRLSDDAPVWNDDPAHGIR